MNRTLFTLFFLFAFSVSGYAENEPKKEAISNSQIKQIRKISTAVLAARKHAPVCEEMDQLKKDLNELKKGITVVYESLQGPVATEDIENLNEKKSHQKKHESNTNVENIKLKSALGKARVDLARLKTRREKLSGRKPQSLLNMQSLVLDSASAKIKELEHKLEALLNEPSLEKAKRVRNLLAHMQPNAKFFKSRPLTKPHMTTIVRHRRR